jgi:cytosine/adenosine deaminase-related metal-dependent hydrolase
MPWVGPGEGLLAEINMLALAYKSNEAALAAATSLNGRHVAPGQIGIIAPGLRADILLLPSDPTRDLHELRDWKIEIVDGRRYDRAVVDGWVEQYRRHFHGLIYSILMDSLTAIAIRQFANTEGKPD